MNDTQFVDFLLGNELAMTAFLTVAMTWFIEAANNNGLGDNDTREILGQFGNDIVWLVQKYEVNSDISNASFETRQQENAYYNDLLNLYELYEKKLAMWFADFILNKESIELICDVYKEGSK